MRGVGTILFAAAVLAPAAAAFAAPIALVNDTFDVGSPPTVADDGADPSDVAWTGRGSAGTTVGLASDATFNTGNALLVSKSGADQAFTIAQGTAGSFTATTLNNVGDSMTLTLGFHFVDGPGAGTSTGVRFALGSITAGTLGGYCFEYGSGGTAGANFMKTTTNQFTSGGTTITANGTAGSVNDLSAHALSLQLTRTSGGVDLAASVGGAPFAASDTTSPQLNFNTIQVENGAANTYAIDNVTVSSGAATPEPASAPLAAVAGLLLLARRRGRP